MKPGKGVKQKVWVVVTECQTEAFHDGEYNMEGVKHVDTCNKRFLGENILSYLKPDNRRLLNRLELIIFQ